MIVFIPRMECSQTHAYEKLKYRHRWSWAYAVKPTVIELPSKSDAPDKVDRHSQMTYQLHYEFNIFRVGFCCTTPLWSWDFCALEGMKCEVAVISFEQAVSINQLDYCTLGCLTEAVILTDKYPRWNAWWYVKFVIELLPFVASLIFDILHKVQHPFCSTA